MKDFKIFGQEPAAVVTAVEAVLAVALSFGLFGLSQEQTGVILAVISSALGLVAAYATQNTLLSALTGFVKSALVLAVTFGFALTDGQQAAILSAVALVAGLWLRDNNASLETPVSAQSPGAFAGPGTDGLDLAA